MIATYPLRWNLDAIFPGGSESPELESHLQALSETAPAFAAQVEALRSPATVEDLSAWFTVFEGRSQVYMKAQQAGAFVYALMSDDTRDTRAKVLAGRLQQLMARFQGLEIKLKEKIRQAAAQDWQRLLDDARFAPFTFRLQELREDVAEMLPPEQETLLSDLSVDGFHAWARLYQTLVSKVIIEIEIDGKVERLSAGQAHNKFSNADGAFRKQLMEKWEQAWSEQEELFAATLNAIAGFRLTDYKHHGWESPLARGLKGNRMSEATLTAMWAAINARKDLLVSYLDRKARLIGKEKLDWYDEQAPLPGRARTVSYDEACRFVIDNFAQFSPRMAQFAERALTEGWVEVEDRPHKGPGGYCTQIPLLQQSRIFMTYGGNTWGIFTLAHELGHAYHNEVQWDLPHMARGFTMSTAETASTFAETVVTQAALKSASSQEERLAILDASARETVTMFMNIQARFLFEQRLYEARKKAPLSVAQLNQLMEECQKEAFGGGLASYHPRFWASKGHFYGTGTPFYNYPYTFGMLFAAGVYARALKSGPGFAQRYDDLLRDTGRMTTEELAQLHLGVDLTQPEFWQEAVDAVTVDLQEFLALTE